MIVYSHVMFMTATISIYSFTLSQCGCLCVHTCVNDYGYGLFILCMFEKMYIHADSEEIKK